MGVLVLALAAMWFYALSGLARKDHVDTLGDPSFAAAAEPLCSAALADLEQQPASYEVADASARADNIEETTAILERLVSDLRPLIPDDDGDATLIDAWLSDWAVYLSDRYAYAEELRGDPSAPFLVTARGNRQITVPRDKFAEVTGMPTCRTPGAV